MAFGPKVKLAAVKLPPVAVPHIPLAGGGGALDEHGFSPGLHGGAGGRDTDAASGINQSRAGRFGFGQKGGAKGI